VPGDAAAFGGRGKGEALGSLDSLEEGQALAMMPSVAVEQRRSFKVATERQRGDGLYEAAAYEVNIAVRGPQRLSEGELVAVMTAAVSSCATGNPDHQLWGERQISSDPSPERESGGGGGGGGAGGGGEGGGGGGGGMDKCRIWCRPFRGRVE